MPAPSSLQIVLTGRPRWRSETGEGALARIDAAWLCLLALSAPCPRERVAAWLWPQASQRQANTALRQRLFKLRRATGHPLIDAGPLLQWADGVRAQVDGDGAPDAVLLGGFDYGDLEAFEAWLTQQRERLTQHRVDRWSGEAARLEAGGEIATALVIAERIVALRPTLEHGWRRLIRLHYLRGDRSAAIACFERFEQEVCRELGIRPSAETQALLMLVERADRTAGGAASPLPVSLLRPPRLVGREDSLRTMTQAWLSGRPVLIRGESGIGKTRLAHAFLAERPGSVWVGLRASGSSMPYSAIGALLGAAFEHHHPALDDAQRQELARLLPALGQASPRAADQSVLWQSVRAALAASARQGLRQIVMDDLHHADEASLELLRWLLTDPSLTDLRWCLIAHPEAGPDGRVARCLVDGSPLVAVALSPLPRAAIAELVGTLELPAPLRRRPDLVDSLARHAGGHPFFTLETLKALILDGVSAGDALPVPAAARTRIDRRIAGVSRTARDLLALLALADPPLPLTVCAAALDVSLAQLAGAWRELDTVQLTQGEAIAHDLVRESVLATLPPPARRALHLALARQLDAHGGVPPHRLAEHWSGAHAWPQALDAWRSAARQARMAGRLEACEALMARALSAAEQGADEDAAFEARCQMLTARLLRQGAAFVLDDLHALLRRTKAAERRSRLHTMIGEALLAQVRPDDAMREAQQALARARRGRFEWIEANVLSARALAMRGRTDEAIERLRAVGDGLDSSADPQRVVRAEAALANALHLASRHAEALHWQSRAIARARAAGDATEVSLLLSNQVAIAAHVGDARLAYRAAGEARRQFAAMGVDSSQSQTLAIYHARLAAHHGRLDEAFAAIAPIAALDPGRHGATIPALAIAAQAGFCLWLGDEERLDEAGARLVALPIEPEMPSVQATLLLTRLRLAAHRGEPVDGDHQRLLALGRAHPDLRQVPRVYREWAAWDPPGIARAQLERLIAACRERGADGARRTLELVWLDLAGAQDPDAAVRLARRLQREIGRGLLAGAYPPAAWWTLACVWRAAARTEAAEVCTERARRWIRRARLPGRSREERARFESAGPVNRAVMARAADP